MAQKNKKRVLIITYNWPPSGGVSLLRSLKITKYLRNFGWEPVVYTAKDASYPYYDEWNFKDIPEGIEILKQPILEPFDIFKKLSGRKKEDSLNNVVHVRTKKSFIDNFAVWVRGNFFIPDARSLWVKPSVKYLVKYLKENPVDAIFSDGPPHTNTWIAYQVAQKTNTPWLMDFQDPWTQVDYYPLLKIGKRADRRHKEMEQLCLKRANKTTIASPSWKEDLESIGAHHVDVIYYGYDEEDFQGLKETPSNEFVISHAGLLGYDRSPDALIQALKKLLKKYPELQNVLKIKLAGQVDFSIKTLFSDAGLDANVEYLGMVSRNEALTLMLNSQILLLPLNKAANAKGRLPGKIYEYLRARNQILAFGPLDSDASKIIEDTASGVTYTYEDEDGSYSFVESKFLLWKKGELNKTTANIKFYSNLNQTGIIAGYLDEISKQKNQLTT